MRACVRACVGGCVRACVCVLCVMHECTQMPNSVKANTNPGRNV
jgi:hypothetical protein